MKKNSLNKLKHVVVGLKGLWIGGTMTVPGVSGGSMAMLLGIYENLIYAISSFFKNVKSNTIFLLEFIAGAGIGLLLFSQSIMMLLDKFPMPTSYFFLGAVAGGIPLILKEAKIKKFSFKIPVFMLVGIALVLLLGLLPENLFASHDGGVLNFLIKIAGGFIIAIALVLPGISVSQMLLMMGLYEEVFGSVKSFDLLPLIPLGIGLALGIVITTKLLGSAMEKYPQITYLIVFGFVLGSLPQLFPGIPVGMDILFCILTAVLGFLVIYAMMKGNEKLNASNE